MKRILIICLLASSVILLKAQSIITLPSDTSIGAGTISDEFDPFDVHLEVINNTGQQQTFSWMMKSYTTPAANWEVKLCDNNNCYDLLINPGPYESLSVDAYDTMDFKFQFSPHCLTGTGTADVVAWLTGDSAATSKALHFRANVTTACATAIKEVDDQIMTLFPNPVRSSFVIRGLENPSAYTFGVYDTKGALARAVSYTGSEVSVDGLPAGVYVLKATSKSGDIFTTRLNKID